MNSFRAGLLKAPVDLSLVYRIRYINEHRGKMELYKVEIPEALTRFHERMISENVEATAKLDGIASQVRVRELLDGAAPAGPEERGLLDYRDTLHWIFTAPRKPESLRGLAEELHRRITRAERAESRGRKTVARQQLSVHEPRDRMDVFLSALFEDARGKLAALDQLEEDRLKHGHHLADPLLTLGAELFEFLYEHPFPDYNGRVARALLTHSLNRLGYDIAKFSGLDWYFHSSEEFFHRAFIQSAVNRERGKHTLVPWLEQFLDVIWREYRDFDAILQAHMQDSQGERVRSVVLRMPKTFSIGELERFVPGVSRTTINRVLRSMSLQKEIAKAQVGRYALWERVYYPQ